MKTSNSIKSIAEALNKAQAVMPTAAKDGLNPHFKSKFSTLATVMQTALPVLTEHGLSIAQFVTTMPTGGSGLTSVLMHTSGEFIEDTMALMPVANTPQAQGSAITYARRYAFMAMIGMVAEEDDDGNAATESVPADKTPIPARKDIVHPHLNIPDYEGEDMRVSGEEEECKQCGGPVEVRTAGPTAKNPGREFWYCPTDKFSHWKE